MKKMTWWIFKPFIFLFLVTFFMTFSACKLEKKEATLILKNGNIVTVDNHFTYAQAIAVNGNKIIKVGSNNEINRLSNKNTKIIDLKGKTVVPGLIDAHGHLLGLGQFLENIDLKETKSFEDIVEKVKEKAKSVPIGTWILGRGWDQNDWENQDFPVHELLSKAVPNHPVWLTRIDGHAGLANQKAMEMAKITSSTTIPSGGKAIKNEKGKFTGVFVDNAEWLIRKVIPALSDEDKLRLLEKAGTDCLSKGLTSMGDAGIPVSQIKLYKKLVDSGKMPIRIYAMLDQPEKTDYDKFFLENKIDSYGDNMFFVKSVKLYVDGALGSRGAAMLEPYSDDPENMGLITIEKEDALKITEAALRNGIQVCTHAIGDKGNRLILDIYEEALKTAKKADTRFRVEHAQIISEKDIPRFQELNVIPSMQPTHATSDMYWAEKRVGKERIEGAYAWRSILDSGCIIPCGSDFPIESNDPLLGFYAAVTRQDTKQYPEGGWYPKQKMTREEALKGFTIWAAKAGFMENFKGSIEVGKLADFTVLSKDIMKIESKEILTTEVEYTVVDGKVMYKKH